MTRIHTITYEQAEKWYDSGRKYKPIGTKLTKSIWLNYDEANDRYTLAYTYSKWYETINEQGEMQYKKASAKERDKYTQKMIGFIYKDYAHIFHPGRLTGANCTARNFFESYFNCTYRKSPGVKVKGFEWTFFREGLSYWQRIHGAGEVELSGAGLHLPRRPARSHRAGHGACPQERAAERHEPPHQGCASHAHAASQAGRLQLRGLGGQER